MPERHSFTVSEDGHLVQFIAVNNPDASGRKGNKLYKTLVENPNRWPWSKSHPWQSWRERYKTNAVWFDRKIKRYLRQQKAAKEAAAAGPSDKVPDAAEGNQAGGRTVTRNGLSGADKHKRTLPLNQQLSASLDGRKPTGDGVNISKHTENASTDSGYGSATKKTEESAAEQAEQAKKCNGEDDYMHELFGSSVEEVSDVSEPEEPPAPSAPGIYPDLRNIAPPAERNHDLDIDMNGSVMPSGPTPEPEKSRLPSSLRSSRPIRYPVGLLHTEKRQSKRKVSGEDPFIDVTRSPAPSTPERHIATRKAPPVLNEGPFRNIYAQARNPGESVDVWPPNRKRNENGPSKITEFRAPAPKSITGQKIQQANAVSSSSRVKLPPSTALRPDDPLLIGTASQRTASQKATHRPVAVFPRPQPMVDPNIGSSWAHATEQPPTKRQKLVHPPVTRESAHSTIPTSRPVTRISQINSCANDESPAIRHIDLRESLRIRRVRSGKDSLPVSNSAPISNPITNRRNSPASSPSHRQQRDSYDDDLEIISLFERDLVRLGEQYGFTLRVVKGLYVQFGTLEKTVLALQALNTMMRGMQDQLPEEMQRLGSTKDDATNDDDLIPESVIPTNVSSRGDERKKEMGEGDILPNKRHRLSLNYKPFTNGVGDQAEYSSPSRTRAGRYTKLQKEGREEGALNAVSGEFALHLRNDREIRVSGAGDVHRRATRIKRGMEPSSPLDPDRERLPKPDEGEVVGLRKTGGEEEHDEEDGNDFEHTLDNSSDQSEMRAMTPEVEQVDDEELVLKAAHKKLCSEVTLKHRDAFEEGRDGDDMWREEGRAWFKERFSNLKEVQEIRGQEFYRTEAKKAEEAEGIAPSNVFSHTSPVTHTG